MTDELCALAKCVLDSLAADDERDFQRNGCYTAHTKAGMCKIRQFKQLDRQTMLDEFNLFGGIKR